LGARGISAIVGFNRYFLIYVIGATLSVAYNSSVASQPYDGYNDMDAPDVTKVKKQQRNPWAVRKPVEREFFQQHISNMPGYHGSKYITKEELDALNNPPVINDGAGVSHGWQPLPALNEGRQRPDYYNPPLYRQSQGNRYDNSSRGTELKTDNNQWNQPPAALPMLPVDPMDPGRFGTPFSGPFNRIDSLMYE